MLSSQSKHPNCAYLWTKWVSTPKVQAQQAIYFGETPANTKACAEMDKLSAGSCKQYHADAPASYFDSIKFWKTPSADCGNERDELHGLQPLAAGLDRDQGLGLRCQ